jgi:hypothetical protein
MDADATAVDRLDDYAGSRCTFVATGFPGLAARRDGAPHQRRERIALIAALVDP